MLTQVVVDSYQRIALAELDLSGSSVHVFAGGNEHGKSTLIEAIAFAIRGVSPRVAKKNQYNELVFDGKKNGSVLVAYDGFTVRRTIKDGKTNTIAPLDYPDLLVDIALGREQFGTADEKALRKMLMQIFNVDGNIEYVTHRLKAKGIDDVIIKQCLPLLHAGGFGTAHQAAKDKQTEERGRWKEVTGETYGAVKAETWRPAELDSLPVIQQADIDVLKQQIVTLKQERDAAQQQLSALESSSKKAEALNITESLEELETLLVSLVENQKLYMGELSAQRSAMEKEVEACNQDIEAIKRQIEMAKMAIATLECPGCAKPLVLHTEGKDVRLVAASAPRREGPSLESLKEQLDSCIQVKKDAVAARTRQIGETERRFNEVTKEVTRTNEKIAVVKAGAVTITPEQIETAQGNVELAESLYQSELSRLSGMERNAEQRSRLVQQEIRAKQIAMQMAQWNTVEIALSNNADSIPSELLQKTIGPLNQRIAEIVTAFGYQPIVVDSSMQIHRGDGKPYYMLSKSARWRADMVCQLAIASLSNFKIVAIDEFDVLEVQARPNFFNMLLWYAERHPDVTVIAAGTLKSAPSLPPGIKTWWVENGQITEASNAS